MFADRRNTDRGGITSIGGQQRQMRNASDSSRASSEIKSSLVRLVHFLIGLGKSFVAILIFFVIL